MPKGYWIANVRVDDAEAYELYRAANAKPLSEYGARFLVRGGKQSAREGDVFPRTVVLEFDSYDIAVACYESEGYQSAKALRDAVSEGRLTIVEGYGE